MNKQDQIWAKWVVQMWTPFGMADPRYLNHRELYPSENIGALRIMYVLGRKAIQLGGGTR